jgi:ABC-2 type transport system ATP-binding protein
VKIIETFDLTKEFNGLVAVDKLNFSVKKGEIFGFLGPNGAGKTTTINMLTTLIMPTSGSAKVNGFDIVEEAHEVRKSIGIVPQDVVLERDLTAKENLLFQGELYGVPRKELEERIPQLLEMVELKGRENSRVRTFSGGMRRRLEIIKAFLHKPSIIFMDEPTTGLDPQSRRVVWEHILRLNKEEGVTIFLTTHYMEEADFLCDRIGIMDFGKLLDLDTPANLKGKIAHENLIEVKFSGDSTLFLKALKEGCGCDVKLKEEGFLRIAVAREGLALSQLVKIADEVGVVIESLSIREPTLEDVFIHYTGRKIRDEKAENAAREVIRRMKG